MSVIVLARIFGLPVCCPSHTATAVAVSPAMMRLKTSRASGLVTGSISNRLPIFGPVTRYPNGGRPIAARLASTSFRLSACLSRTSFQ
jgi:hypothetical protein